MPTKTAHIDTELHSKLKALALKKGVRLTEMINDLLRKGIGNG